MVIPSRTAFVTRIAIAVFVAGGLIALLVWEFRTAVPYDYTDLVLHYAFDAADAPIRDDSRYGHDGVLIGGTIVLGRIGSAVAFDGVGDGIRIPYAETLRIADAATLAAWVAPAVSDVSEVILGSVPPSGHAGYLLARERNATGSVYAFRAFGATDASIQSLPFTASGAWDHVAVTFDRGALRMYRNGVLVGSETVVDRLTPSSADITVGTGFDGRAAFRGKVDDLRIYNRALTAAEVDCFSRGFMVIEVGCEPIGTNRTPAILSARGDTIVRVNTDAAWAVETYDPDGEPVTVTVEWGDGTSDTAANAAATPRSLHAFSHTYAASGIYKPRFRVHGAAGQNAVIVAEPVTVAPARDQ